MVSRLLALLVMFATAQSAFAQLYARTILSRPSDQSASIRIGQIGGTNTREPLEIGSGSRNPSTLDRVGRGRLPTLRGTGSFFLSEILQPPAIGVAVSPAAQRSPYRPPFVYDEGQIRDATYLSQSLSFELPLTGPPVFGVAVPSRPVIAQGSNDPFKKFFGLAEPRLGASHATRSAVEDGFESVSALNASANDRVAQDGLRRGLAAFREATSARVEDRYDRFRAAAQLLDLASEVNATDPLPRLLSVHAALAQERYLTAWLHLARAVERDPAVFTRQIDLHTYFADPRILDEQARNLGRLSDLTSASPQALAFAAYGALITKDSASLKRMLSELQVRVSSPQTDGAAQRIYYALAAAAAQP